MDNTTTKEPAMTVEYDATFCQETSDLNGLCGFWQSLPLNFDKKGMVIQGSY
jgi:hypothetical protein